MLERLPEFVGNHPVLSLIFIGLVLALIFTEIARRNRGFVEVSPAGLTQLINRHDALLIDVSAHTEFESGHIVNAKHVAPSQLDPAAKPLKGQEEKPVALYCRTGMASEQACKKLVKAGFAKVFWLRGGLQAWLADQLPVTRAK
jgi:rhodanese-related sulfurtransferase